MSDSIDIEHYLAEQTQWPLEEVAEIYRAGTPWPILYKNLEHMAHQDARAAGVSVETAMKALDQVCDMEAAHLNTLVKQAQEAATRAGSDSPVFDLPEVQAIGDHPLIRDWLNYSERVALRVGETESWKVLVIYMKLLNYAWEHPDWEAV